MLASPRPFENLYRKHDPGLSWGGYLPVAIIQTTNEHFHIRLPLSPGRLGLGACHERVVSVTAKRFKPCPRMLALHRGSVNSGTLAAEMPEPWQRIFGSTSLPTPNTHDHWCLIEFFSTALGAQFNNNKSLHLRRIYPWN